MNISPILMNNGVLLLDEDDLSLESIDFEDQDLDKKLGKNNIKNFKLHFHAIENKVHFIEYFLGHCITGQCCINRKQFLFNTN